VARKTKIVATIGPSSSDAATLEAMFVAGVDVVRLNLSHGTVEEHLARLALVREVAAGIGRSIAVLADLPGPKVRAGRFPEGGVELVPGAIIRVVEGDQMSDAGHIRIAEPGLVAGLCSGDRVILGDGAISLTVESSTDGVVAARVDTGGRTQGAPGVHLSSERLHLTTPTAEDLVLASTMAAAGVEYLAVSFVRQAAELDGVRDVVADRALLIAKIETSAALADLEAIIESADAVMVARGDLGIDCPIEDVPHLQKMIIRECVERGVPVITATQMLESMVSAPSPTRAEVSDVANAVFDGTDALMLSGETAVGHDPVAVVSTMAAVAERAEREASYRAWADRLGRVQRSRWDSVSDRITAALGHAASQAARDVEASAILCCTRSGRTARAMARFRPEATLIGLSPDPQVVRAMSLSWGIDPITVDEYVSTDEMVWYAVETAVRSGRVAHGDTVLVLAGSPDRTVDTAADVLRIVRVG
jgi:pyruvate kinase